MMIDKLLETDLLTEQLFYILENMDSIQFNCSLDEVSDLYGNCIFINKDEFEGYDCDIYDRYGDLIMHLDKDLINDYSSEDYLNSPLLYRQLCNQIQKIEDAEVLGLLC